MLPPISTVQNRIQPLRIVRGALYNKEDMVWTGWGIMFVPLYIILYVAVRSITCYTCVRVYCMIIYQNFYKLSFPGRLRWGGGPVAFAGGKIALTVRNGFTRPTRRKRA